VVIVAGEERLRGPAGARSPERAMPVDPLAVRLETQGNTGIQNTVTRVGAGADARILRAGAAAPTPTYVPRAGRAATTISFERRVLSSRRLNRAPSSRGHLVHLLIHRSEENVARACAYSPLLSAASTHQQSGHVHKECGPHARASNVVPSWSREFERVHGR
jgi:hypothetical protein